MRDDQLSEIRSLLRSGEVIEIGGRPQRTAPAPPATAGLLAAFAAIYLIWGSTYLAIRYAVETFPPLLMMGVRHLTAGAVLYGWSRWRGVPSPTLRGRRHRAWIGTLFFGGGLGSLAWAERRWPP